MKNLNKIKFFQLIQKVNLEKIAKLLKISFCFAWNFYFVRQKCFVYKFLSFSHLFILKLIFFMTIFKHFSFKMCRLNIQILKIIRSYFKMTSFFLRAKHFQKKKFCVWYFSVSEICNPTKIKII